MFVGPGREATVISSSSAGPHQHIGHIPGKVRAVELKDFLPVVLNPMLERYLHTRYA